MNQEQLLDEMTYGSTLEHLFLKVSDNPSRATLDLKVYHFDISQRYLV
jgi:hypothetical protein